MSSESPRISVIISTCNRAGFVADAINSVLDQNGETPEVIVVDDGSVDDTAEVVKRFGQAVRYGYQDNAGPSAARNRGIRLAQGDVLGFLDDDDLWSPDKLAVQMPILRGEPQTDIVLGHTQRMVCQESAAVEQPFIPYKNPVRLFSLGCALFRRTVFDRVGLLDENMRHAEDDDWFMRARAMKTEMRFLSEVSLYYRFHAGNMSLNKDEKLPYMLRLVKNRLDRIRREENKE